MRKIFVSLLIVTILCGISSADIVYTTTDGKLGLIKTPGAASTDVEGVKYLSGFNNPLVQSYWDNGQSRLILVERKTSDSDTALRFNPSNLTTPIDTEAIELTNVSNTQKILSINSGTGIFFVNGNSIIELNTSNFISRDHAYTYSEDVDIKDAVIHGEGIFVLVDNLLLHFDGQLDENNAKNFRKWEAADDSEVIGSMGSRIVIGSSTGIDVLSESSASADLINTSNPVKAICSDTGSGFYYVTQGLSDDVYVNSLYHYSNSTSDRIFSGVEGEKLKLIRTGSILVILIGDTIMFYDIASDSKTAEYNAADLGGIPFDIAMSTSTGEKKDEGGSGCNIFSTGIIISALMLVKRRREKFCS